MEDEIEGTIEGPSLFWNVLWKTEKDGVLSFHEDTFLMGAYPHDIHRLISTYGEPDGSNGLEMSVRRGFRFRLGDDGPWEFTYEANEAEESLEYLVQDRRDMERERGR